jgi:hypothetical protein
MKRSILQKSVSKLTPKKFYEIDPWNPELTPEIDSKFKEVNLGHKLFPALS